MNAFPYRATTSSHHRPQIHGFYRGDNYSDAGGYGNGHIYETGKFRGKRALLSLTTGGPPGAYTKGGFNGDIDAILRPIQRGILQFVGFDVLAPQICYAPVRADDATRKTWLADWEKRLVDITTESPISVGPY